MGLKQADLVLLDLNIQRNSEIGAGPPQLGAHQRDVSARGWWDLCCPESCLHLDLKSWSEALRVAHVAHGEK